MKYEQLLEEMKERMPEKRWIHTKGVTLTAIKLAQKYGVDQEKAEIAGILHDCVKYAEKEWLKEKIITEGMDPLLLEFHHELWHAPVGSYVAEHEYDIKDQDTLNAIKYHTTGRVGMSDLEKIVYIADMIEPNRQYPGVDVLREVAEKDLNDAMLQCVQHSIAFLINKKQSIYPDSFHCYNDLVRREEK